MSFHPDRRAALLCVVFAGGLLAAAEAGPGAPQPAPNPTGSALTFTRKKRIDTNNPFFQSLGTNGRSCNSCHVESAGWSLSPTEIEARFAATDGLDPLFRTNDGSTSPNADVSTVEARWEAYRLLRTRGLIRVGIGVPAGAEFTLEAVDDPYGHASSAELSLFRRPLPATNLKFTSTVMWDGRKSTPGQKLVQNLADQALDATMGHAAAATPPSAAVLTQIVNFENALFTAQSTDNGAGRLNFKGGKGGPVPLSRQSYRDGINNPFSGRPRGFNPQAFKLFTSFKRTLRMDPDQLAARQSIARGEIVFNQKQFPVSGVAGLNDVQGVARMTVTCTTCHNTPNVGGSSFNGLMDIGVSAAARRTPDLPLYTLHRTGTGEVRQTTDPGRALITGKWADVDRFKAPSMRGLASRAPYFHDGSAATLGDVVDFYNERFAINLSQQQMNDLVAFLRSL
ncbi:MAG: hypothetical protein ACO1SX_23095 [Actinomycetota bacterium]